MSETPKATFEGYAIVEQMGHKRMAARLSEAVIGGHSFIRCDVPGANPGDPDIATQFITGQTIYAITPCSEALARKVAANHQPQPVTEWDLRTPALPAGRFSAGDDDDDPDEPMGGDE